jgi:hypothetical protein
MLRDTAACKSSTNYVYDFGGKNLVPLTVFADDAEIRFRSHSQTAFHAAGTAQAVLLEARDRVGWQECIAACR